MKISRALVESMTCCILIGCACDHSKPQTASNPDKVTVVGAGNATFGVTATGSAPLTYQWYVGTNATNASLFYQWYKGTNGDLSTIVLPATNR